MTNRSIENRAFSTIEKILSTNAVLFGLNLSRVRNRAAAPRCQASIDRARRLPEARPRPSTLGGQGTGPIFIYPLHRHELVHRGFEPSVPGLWWSSGATGGARRDRCRHREVRNAGRFAYHAESTNFRAVGAFRLHTIRLWRHTLRHRKCAPLLKPAACP